MLELYVKGPSFGDYFRFQIPPQVGHTVELRDKVYTVITIMHSAAEVGNGSGKAIICVE
jgi:hypothetical protein